MEMVHAEIERYALEHTSAQGERLDALEAEARAKLPNPQMLSGPVVGRLLELLVHGVQARLVLEIGTYAGYSALAMAQGLAAGGRVLTCEISPDYAAFAREHIAASPHAECIEVLEGPALQTLEQLEGPFDFVFIDADKTGYPAYFEAVLDKLSPHGLIAADNMLRAGAVLDGARPERDASTEAIVAFNEALAHDERVVCSMLTVRDGITLIRRR
jgi:caffeoyl-CoA O-methyltransferase